MAKLMARNRLLVFICATLLILASIQLAQATFFLIGSACVIGLDTALRLVGQQLRDLNLDEAIEVIRNFCRTFTRLTPTGIALDTLEPAVRDLIDFINEQGNNLPQVVDQLADRIRDLAQQILQANLG